MTVEFDMECVGCSLCDKEKSKIMREYQCQMHDLATWYQESLAALAQDHADGKHIEEHATAADEAGKDSDNER